jgi:hypothetical protein
VTAARAIGRSGPEIRAALAQVAPEECARFEAEFKTEAVRAAETFDAAPLDALLERWWGVAVIRANPLTEQEQQQLVRAQHGDLTGMYELDEGGSWRQL